MLCYAMLFYSPLLLFYSDVSIYRRAWIISTYIYIYINLYVYPYPSYLFVHLCTYLLV